MVIYGAQGIIKDVNIAFRVQSTRNGNALLLAARKRHTALADGRLVARGQNF